MSTVAQRVNVAPSSTEGHFVEGAEQVVMVDEVSEMFIVKGKSTLHSKNHTTLKQEEDCIIFSQDVVDQVSKMYQISRD